MFKKRGTDPRPSKKGGRSRATSKAGSAKQRRVSRGSHSRAEQELSQRPRPVTGRDRPVKEKGPRPKRRPVAERGKQPARSVKSRAQRQITPQMRAQRARRRRMLKLIGTGLVIFVAVLAVMWLVSFSLKKIEEHTTPPDPARAFDPIPCQLEFLETSIDNTAAVAGQPVGINVTLKNAHGTAPCLLGTSASDFSVKITSGDYTAYDSAACERGVDASRLLLDKGVESTQTFTWDGKNSGSTCTSGGVAQPGTYKAQVFYLGEPLTEDGHVFTISAPPPPAP